MDDSQLVALARTGDEGAVEELFGRVWPLAWHWAYGVTGERMLADHGAQDAILRAVAALDRFDPARPFRPWLKRITVNIAIALMPWVTLAAFLPLGFLLWRRNF